MLIYIDIQWW